MVKIDNATLYNQDCLEFLKGVEGGSVDCVLVDPPYKIDTTGGGVMAKRVLKDLQAFSDGFEEDVLHELCRVLKKINIYIFCSKAQIPWLLNYFIEKKCNFDILTWHKNNPLPFCGDSYLPDTEYILFFREKGVFFGGTYATKKKFYISNSNTTDKKLYGHPTCKPVELLKRFIINSSQENDLVLDCFSGSGSTAVACLQEGRQFIGCERDKTYFDNSIERLKNWKEDLARQEKWLEDRGVEDFKSDIQPENEQCDLFK